MARGAPRTCASRAPRTWSDDGGDFDFDRIQAFRFSDGFIARKRGASMNPGVVHLVGCTGFPNVATTESLGWTGAPAVAVARVLMDAGYSVTLDVCRSVARTGGLCRTLEVVRLLEGGTALETDTAVIAAVACWDVSVSGIGWMHRRIAQPLGSDSVGAATRNPARDYVDVARHGLLPLPAWTFDMAFDRAGAVASAKNGLRAILAGIAPEDALDTRSAYEQARDAGVTR